MDNEHYDKEYNLKINPSYYRDKCSLECIEVMRVMFGDTAAVHYCACTAFAYLWRYKYKNGTEDLYKAKWFIDYYDNHLDRALTEKEREGINRIKSLLYRLMGIDNAWEGEKD